MTIPIKIRRWRRVRESKKDLFKDPLKSAFKSMRNGECDFWAVLTPLIQQKN